MKSDIDYIISDLYGVTKVVNGNNEKCTIEELEHYNLSSKYITFIGVTIKADDIEFIINDNNFATIRYKNKLIRSDTPFDQLGDMRVCDGRRFLIVDNIAYICDYNKGFNTMFLSYDREAWFKYDDNYNLKVTAFQSTDYETIDCKSIITKTLSKRENIINIPNVRFIDLITMEFALVGNINRLLITTTGILIGDYHIYIDDIDRKKIYYSLIFNTLQK